MSIHKNSSLSHSLSGKESKKSEEMCCTLKSVRFRSWFHADVLLHTCTFTALGISSFSTSLMLYWSLLSVKSFLGRILGLKCLIHSLFNPVQICWIFVLPTTVLALVQSRAHTPLSGFQLVGHVLQNTGQFNGIFPENSSTKTCKTWGAMWKQNINICICIRIHRRATEQHICASNCNTRAPRPKHFKKWHLTTTKNTRSWDQFIQHLDVSEERWRRSHLLWSHDEIVVSSCFIFSFSGLAKASIMQSAHTVKASNRSWHALQRLHITRADHTFQRSKENHWQKHFSLVLNTRDCRLWLFQACRSMGSFEKISRFQLKLLLVQEGDYCAADV